MWNSMVPVCHSWFSLSYVRGFVMDENLLPLLVVTSIKNPSKFNISLKCESNLF